MKRCNECNIEMINNCDISGQHPFEIGMDGHSYITISYVDGKKTVKGFLGKETQQDNFCSYKLKARICPKCGKIELYADISN